jgi:hypothetical protein
MSKEESINKLKDRLDKIEMSEYLDIFIQNDLIDENVLNTLNDNDLEKVGITILGHKKKLIMEFSKKNEDIQSNYSDKQKKSDYDSNKNTNSEENETSKSPWKIVGWLIVIVLIIIIIGAIGI